MSLNTILWVTDPWETLDHKYDTTLRLAEEGLILNLESYWCSSADILLIDHIIYAIVKQIHSIVRENDEVRVELSNSKKIVLSYFAQIQYRTDPPVDLKYIQPLQLLALAKKKYQIRVEADPSSLITFSEKTIAALIPEAMPQTLVSSNGKEIEEFLRKNFKIIIKPLNSCQSKGVQCLEYEGDNYQPVLRKINAAVGPEQNLILLQRFLPDIYDGEKRIFILDGQILAACLKRPADGYLINDYSTYGYVELSPDERSLALKIGRLLVGLGIRLSAVDMIGGLVTDLNITSPGLLIQTEKIIGENLAIKIMQALMSAFEPALD